MYVVGVTVQTWIRATWIAWQHVAPSHDVYMAAMLLEFLHTVYNLFARVASQFSAHSQQLNKNYVLHGM